MESNKWLHTSKHVCQQMSAVLISATSVEFLQKKAAGTSSPLTTGRNPEQVRGHMEGPRADAWRLDEEKTTIVNTWAVCSSRAQSTAPPLTWILPIPPVWGATWFQPAGLWRLLVAFTFVEVAYLLGVVLMQKCFLLRFLLMIAEAGCS